jgi:hypothetical protein
VGHVHPEAVDAPVQPEPQHVVELLDDLGVAPVQVGLLVVEQVQVPLAGAAVGLLHPGPGEPAEDGLPVVRRLGAVRARPVAEDVAGPLAGTGPGGQRLAEPRVLVAGVVGHQVDEDADPQLVRPGDELVGVGERPEQGVDVAVVGHVVAGVGHRGDVEGAEPDRVHPQVGQVGQPGGDPGQVADPVAVGVGEAARVDLVDHRVPPPGRRVGDGLVRVGGVRRFGQVVRGDGGDRGALVGSHGPPS